MGTVMRVEDLDAYQKLCQLHIEACDVSHGWPAEGAGRAGVADPHRLK